MVLATAAPQKKKAPIAGQIHPVARFLSAAWDYRRPGSTDFWPLRPILLRLGFNGSQLILQKGQKLFVTGSKNPKWRTFFRPLGSTCCRKRRMNSNTGSVIGVQGKW